MYELAQKYYEENGSLLYVKDVSLNQWIQTQRQAYKGKEKYTKLSEEKIQKLEEIGMIWDANAHKWNQMYEQAKKYYDENGNLTMTPSKNKQLYAWLKIQRNLYNKEEGLSEEQRRLLGQIEIFKGIKKSKDKANKNHKESKKTAWNRMYKQAQEYYEINGNLTLPTTDEYSKLNNWVKNQRTKYNVDPKKCKLSKEQIELLESIGMIWNVIDYRWNIMYLQAKSYYEQYGTLSIPDEREKEYKQLRTWIQEQKMKHNTEAGPNLSKEQVEQLEAIGIVWNVNQASYDNMYKQAKEYFEKHGDLLVPENEEYKRLSTWVKNQRTKYKSEKGLPQEEIESLEAIGMVWDARC